MSVRTIRAGAAQVFGSLDIRANLSKMKDYLLRASDKQVKILLFPECFLSGYAPACEQSPGFSYDFDLLQEAAGELHQAAERAGVAVVYGTAWRNEKGAWVNRARVVDTDGSLAGEVDKVHLFGTDHDYFEAAERLQSVEVGGVRLGIGICFDIRFPEIWRKLARQGAEILMNPLAAHGGAPWKLPVMSAHFCSRAAENQRFFVSANSGPRQMAVSEIYDPSGIRLATARAETEQLVWADLPLGEFEEKGRRHLPDFLGSLRTDF